jgi:hypothetical protein
MKTKITKKMIREQLDKKRDRVIFKPNKMAIPFKLYSTEEAKRISRPIRYDILDPDFLEDLAKIADFGAKKYGDLNWQLSRLTADKGPVNHIYKHLGSYRKNEPYDHEELGTQRSLHLAAIAFNAMMEYYWAKKEEDGTLGEKSKGNRKLEESQ